MKSVFTYADRASVRLQFLNALMDVSTTGIRGLNGFEVKSEKRKVKSVFTYTVRASAWLQFLDALMDVSTTGIRGLNGFDVKTILRIRRIIPNSPGVIIQTKKLAKSERRFEETS